MRKLLILLGVLMLSSGLVAQGPVAHWDFSDGSGGVLHDRSGNGNTGRIHGAEWVNIGGGHALKFDGLDDHVDCGSGSSLDITGPITLEAWVNPQTIAARDLGIAGKGISYYALTFYETFAFWYVSAGGNGAEAALTMNTWQHVTSTFDGKTLNLYVNGQLAFTRESKFDSVKQGGNFYIGFVQAENMNEDPSSPDAAHFRGMVGDVRVYNRALTPEEIQADCIRDAAKYGLDDISWIASGTTRFSPDERPNLASAKYDSWTVTSSNANFKGLYADNLIDGDPRTAWRSFQKSKEEYAEFKWDIVKPVSEVEVYQHPLSRISSMHLYAWVQDKWAPVAGGNTGTANQPIVFRFKPVETQKLRLVMKNDQPRYTGLYEVRVFGPEQPLVKLRQGGAWRYEPVSGVEPTGSREAIVVEEAVLTPANPKPGSTMNLTLKLRPQMKLSDDYAFVLTIGEREEYIFTRSDYTVTRVLLSPESNPSTWPEGEDQVIRANIHLPVHAPNGELDVMVHGISPAGRPALRMVTPGGQDIPDGKVARIDVLRFAGKTSVGPGQADAEVDTSTGATLFTIDGKRMTPILFALQTPSFDRYHYYSQVAGVKLYHLQIYPYRIDVGDYQTRNYNFVAQHIRNLLRVDPDAYVIIQMDMRTSKAWQEENPDGCLYTWDGRRMHESFVSKKFRAEGRSYVGNLVKFVQSQPWGNRVMGYLCEVGEPEGVLSGGPDLGDYNPEAIEGFRDFLRKKYGTVEDLRAAYGDPALTFEAVYPHNEKMVEPGADGGVFLHPVKQRLVIDYHAYVSSMVPTFLLEDCAGTIRDLTGGKALAGSYWAYMLEDIVYGKANHQANHSWLHPVLASPDIHFFASPFNYWHPARFAGDPYLVFQPYDTLRVNGKVHIPECDHRTFRAAQPDRGRHRSREESVAITRRDMGTALMHGMGAWFSDWTNNEGPTRRWSEPFFLDDDIMKQIAHFKGIYDKTMDLPRGSAQGEVAVLTSGTSTYYQDNNTRPIYSELIRKTLYWDINMMGLPHDQLIFEDIMKPEVQDQYKMYVFLNAFYMTPEQRTVIDGLKRDGKTLVWIYAPGYISDTELSPANIRATTGFSVEVDNGKHALSYRMTEGNNPLGRGVEDTLFGGRSGTVSPRFVVAEEPGVTVVGRYPDGKAAFAVKDFGTHKSAYCAVPYLPTSVLRNLARYAGCNVYVDEDIYMDATDDFLMLTNNFDGERAVSVQLPSRKDVVDLDTGNTLFRGVTTFRTTLAPGEAAVYRLK